jgi:5-deoxy-glucuronate isomerase
MIQEVCMKRNIDNKARMEKWNYTSKEEAGFHEVIIPGEADCTAIHIYRLNLNAGETYRLESHGLEMNAVLIKGKAEIDDNNSLKYTMDRYDSFYIPGNSEVIVTATMNSVFYIAGARYEGIGEATFRKFDLSLPLGDVHQIHGSGVSAREVMFTLPPHTPASSLICGLTWSGEGAWTSWPPHQHENDLEEAYCYFDMDAPKFGLHLSYLKSGEAENIVAHTVQSGSMVLAPCGYHPTVASPGTKNAYFWALAAFKPSSRSYDLAIIDPVYSGT